MVRLCYKSIKEGMNQLKINKTQKKIVLLFAFIKSTREKERNTILNVSQKQVCFYSSFIFLLSNFVVFVVVDLGRHIKRISVAIYFVSSLVYFALYRSLN